MAELGTTWLECFHERKAICPYCGIAQAESWEFEEGETETECDICGEPFIVECEITASYTTEPIGGWPE